jgi:hypothetical protein
VSRKVIRDGDEARMEEGLVRLHQGVRHKPFPVHPPAPPPPRVKHAHLAQWREREEDRA